MKIIYGYPPNYDVIAEAFDIKANENVIFTYGDELFVPMGEGTKLDAPLLKHEETHSRQQKEMGIQYWWDNFIFDPKFRLEQELEAYRAQYKAMGSFTPEARAGYLTHIAKDLSSAIYGNVITFEQAVQVITEGINFNKSRYAGGTVARKAKKILRQNRKKGRK